MSANHLKYMLSTLLAALLAAFTAATAVAQSGLSKEVDGVTLHLGVMPTKTLTDHPELLPKGHPLPLGKDMYHLLVAVIDSETGERITDAEVEATVSPLGLAGRTKSLDPAAPADMLTYCNFFKLPAGDTYTVKVGIRRPGNPVTKTARFTLKQFTK